MGISMILVAERLVCMYVSVMLRNAIYMAGGLPDARTQRTFCRTFGICMDNEDDERSRHLATLDTHMDVFPPVIWQLKR